MFTTLMKKWKEFRNSLWRNLDAPAVLVDGGYVNIISPWLSFFHRVGVYGSAANRNTRMEAQSEEIAVAERNLLSHENSYRWKRSIRLALCDQTTKVDLGKPLVSVLRQSARFSLYYTLLPSPSLLFSFSPQYRRTQRRREAMRTTKQNLDAPIRWFRSRTMIHPIDSTWSWREGKDFDRVTKYRGLRSGGKTSEMDGWKIFKFSVARSLKSRGVLAWNFATGKLMTPEVGCGTKGGSIRAAKLWRKVIAGIFALRARYSTVNFQFIPRPLHPRVESLANVATSRRPAFPPH